jgi:hypothetical protein
MNWSEISSAVGKDAPLLGTVLAGRAGGAVGPLVAAALGTEATPEAVSAVLASPEAAVRLRRIETAHRAKLQEIQLEQTRAELADVADARARDVALVQAGRNNRRADVMVLIDAVGLIACLVVLVISTIASIFGLCLRDAHSFEFGSSRSSQVKDATIRELAK